MTDEVFQIRGAEHGWLQAVAEHDVDTLAELLAPGFTMISARTDEYAAAAAGRSSPGTAVSRLSRVRVLHGCRCLLVLPHAERPGSARTAATGGRSGPVTTCRS